MRLPKTPASSPVKTGFLEVVLELEKIMSLAGHQQADRIRAIHDFRQWCRYIGEGWF